MSPTGIQDLCHIRDRFFIEPFSLHLLLYIWTPNKGKAAAKYDLANEFAARALAAYTGYWSAKSMAESGRGPIWVTLTASTRKVKTPEYTQITLSHQA